MAKTTGSGAFTYRHRPLELPPIMQEHLVGAHGAFAPDREAAGGDGSTWFSLKNVGLLRLDPALARIEVIGGDPRIVAANVHGACLFRHEGQTYLGLPSNDAETVWIADTAGRVIRTFPNPYGPEGNPFKVCDVDVIDGLLYAANGYADNVCFTCDPLRGLPDDPAVGSWEPTRFGGEGAGGFPTTLRWAAGNRPGSVVRVPNTAASPPPMASPGCRARTSSPSPIARTPASRCTPREGVSWLG
jgi:hypothetical protein